MIAQTHVRWINITFRRQTIDGAANHHNDNDGVGPTRPEMTILEAVVYIDSGVQRFRTSFCQEIAYGTSVYVCMN